MHMKKWIYAVTHVGIPAAFKRLRQKDESTVSLD